MENRIIAFNIRDEGIFTLTKANPSTDGDDIEYDIDLVSDLEADDLEALKTRAPGIEDYASRATDNKDGTVIKLQPAQKDIRISISDSNGVEICSGVSAEVRHMTLTLNSNSQRMLVRCRLKSQKADLATPLVNMLDKKVVVGVVPSGQLEMFSGTVDELSPEVGDIVCGQAGDDTVYGRVIEVKANGHVGVDDMGEVSVVETLMSAMIVEGDDRDSLIEGYISEVQELGERPSWRHIVVAFGQAFAANEAEREDRDGRMIFRMTEQIVQRAVGLHLPVDAASNG